MDVRHDANTPPFDANGQEDSAASDSRSTETAIDAQASDTDLLDAGTGIVDAGAPDESEASDARPDAAVADAAVADAGLADAAPDITLVQQAGSHFTVSMASQAAETFPAPTTAGNTIIVLGFWQALGFAATVTDSLGNTYQSTAMVSNPQGGALQIFYVPRSAAGTDTVTLTMGAGFNNYVGLVIFEYSGLVASNLLEGTAGQYAPAAGSAASTPAVATTSSRSLLLAGFADTNGSGMIAPGPGWTSLVTNSAFYMSAEAMIVPATPSVAASATLPTADSRWVALMAAFQAP